MGKTPVWLLRVYVGKTRRREHPITYSANRDAFGNGASVEVKLLRRMSDRGGPLPMPAMRELLPTGPVS